MNDKTAIDELTRQFFSLFTNTNHSVPDLDRIYAIFIPEGMIIKNLHSKTEVYSLAQFIAPRQKILTDGTLQEFTEEEVTEETKIYRNIAQRFCSYKKSGLLSGTAFKGTGMKTMQFVKTTSGWKISSVAWDDED